MEQLKEEIKQVKGYEGLYSISNYGYVISEAKEWIAGQGRTLKKERTILAKRIDTGGYLHIVLNKNKVRRAREMHTLVWDHFGDRKRDGYRLAVDHIDENKLNCRIDNLQLLPQRQNAIKYRKTQKYKTSSKYVGVCWDKRRNNWQAFITINKKHIYLGSFNNEYEAHLAYQAAIPADEI